MRVYRLPPPGAGSGVKVVCLVAAGAVTAALVASQLGLAGFYAGSGDARPDALAKATVEPGGAQVAVVDGAILLTDE